MLNQVGLPASLFGEEGRTGAPGFDWYAIMLFRKWPKENMHPD